MSLSILGLGTALPPNSILQAEAAEAAKRVCCDNADEAALLPVLYRQTGIRKRHMVFQEHMVQEIRQGTALEELKSEFTPKGGAADRGPTTGVRMKRYRTEAPVLAEQACGRALEQANLPPTAVTHLVTVSCTGFSAPGPDIRLFRQLGLSPMVQRVNVGFMGCHGALNGLRVARGLVAADPDAVVLLCAIELCSLHFHYGWDPKKVVANALFADGAAAIVGVHTDSAPVDAWRVAATGSCLIPDSEFAMSWNIGDHGFDMTLSTRVPNLIGEHLRPFMDRWLARFDLSVGQIASWAIHPGGPRILRSVEEPLGISSEDTVASREILAEHGNMSSPTVLFILDRLRQRNAPRPCVALGFGPGLVAEAALFL